MSEYRSAGSGAPGSSLTDPIAAWRLRVAHARERIERIERLHVGGDPRLPAADRDDPAFDELLQTVEELSVAEEELRTQQDEIEIAHEMVLVERERYRSLFEHAPVAYFVTDSNGTIRDANRAAARLMRCPGDRLRRKPLLVFVGDTSRRRVRRLLSRIAPSLPSASVALNVQPRSHRIIRAEANVTAAFDAGGRVTELRWLIVDRNRRAKRERERRADAAELKHLVIQRTAELEREQRLKDQLIATVSHEFRTALSAIGGYAELLAMGVRGPMADAQLADIHRIHAAYAHLAGLVDDLLNYSKLSSGTLTLDLDDVRLSDIVGGLADLVGPQAAKSGIALSIDAIDDDLFVHVDAERARQVLLNLLSNAVKFTPNGGAVALQTFVGSTDVAVRVTDTGPGIAPADAEAIFQPFVRLRASSPGTGLGLAISRDLARAMGGDLSIELDHHPGSCFVLRVPRSTRLAT